MLRELRARGLEYDAKTQEAHLAVEELPELAAWAEASAVLLVDARGKLVGVDLGGEGFQRTVVMLGAHEDVAEQRPARVRVAHASDGAVLEVRIPNAARLTGG